MKKFVKNILLFLIILMISGEFVVRFNHAVSDIPKRSIDEFGIQKYRPNQSGYWKGGNHTWFINEKGWPGRLPKSYDNLISIIGDSYIENFMNPDYCHQSEYLKSLTPQNNFIEFGRSGMSLIEAFEICERLDTLKIKHNLIYVNEKDFYESIFEIKPMSDITQLRLQNSEIIQGSMNSTLLKDVLYNWKLLYYFYNRFLPDINNKNKPKLKPEHDAEKKDLSQKKYDQTTRLLNFIKLNYNIDDKTLVIHPNSDKEVIEIAQKLGFNTILLDSSGDNDWSFEYDSHWTCYGHKQVAKQVTKGLKEVLLEN